MSLLLFLATLPSLYWAQPVETAPALKQAGIERLCVPTEAAAAWTAAGFTVVPLGEKDRSERTKLSAPGLRSRAELASASVRPWVFANGWRFLRKPDGRYWGDVPAGKAALRRPFQSMTSSFASARSASKSMSNSPSPARARLARMRSTMS